MNLTVCMSPGPSIASMSSSHGPFPIIFDQSWASQKGREGRIKKVVQRANGIARCFLLFDAFGTLDFQRLTVAEASENHLSDKIASVKTEPYTWNWSSVSDMGCL